MASDEMLLFDVELKYQTDLNHGTLPDELRQAFKRNNVALSRNVKVSIETDDREWLIVDKDDDRIYTVRRDEDRLKIYDDETAYKKEQALFYWQDALEHQQKGEFSDAIGLYLKSIEIYPTAEAHTYLGWTYSIMGRVEDAIEECRKAIRVDPDFGNPYNDIGAYLIEMGDHDAAIPWLKQATRAPRYEPRGYPHMNLGRVWEHRLEWDKAAACYKRALYEMPDYDAAFIALRRLKAKLN